jgi:hypothetical protein
MRSLPGKGHETSELSASLCWYFCFCQVVSELHKSPTVLGSFGKHEIRSGHAYTSAGALSQLSVILVGGFIYTDGFATDQRESKQQRERGRETNNTDTSTP